MSDSSDVEIVSVIPATRIIDDIDLASSSSEDEDCSENSCSRSMSKAEIEKNRRHHQTVMFEFLQRVVVDNKPMIETWSKKKTILKAVNECKSLTKEEGKLKEEQETLVQENWKLKKRLAKMTKGNAKKLKRTEPPKIAPSSLHVVHVLDNHNVSKDDTNSNQLLERANLGAEKRVRNQVSPEHIVNIPAIKPISRVLKKSGLSEEEKEFYKLEEKIEHLACEVDALWNDIKDDEELSEDSSGLVVFESQPISVDIPIKIEPFSPMKIDKEKKEVPIDRSSQLIDNELNLSNRSNTTDSMIFNNSKIQGNPTNILPSYIISRSNDNITVRNEFNEMKSMNQSKSFSTLKKNNTKSREKKSIGPSLSNSKFNKSKTMQQSSILEDIVGSDRVVKKRKYSKISADKNTAAPTNIGYIKQNFAQVFECPSQLTKGQDLNNAGCKSMPLANRNVLYQKLNEKRNTICVKDINKLVKPQFAQKQVTSSTFEYSKRDDLSDDDSPRLVIDESTLPSNYYSELKTVDIPSTSASKSYSGSSFIYID